jgi:hypothetical protein
MADASRFSVEGLTLGRAESGALEMRIRQVEIAELGISSAAQMQELGGLVLPLLQGAGDAWSLTPLAEANGTINAKITDAHLAFDADVTVPIRQGEIDFGDATVEHVGPNSRMGVSRMGVYVDAPNGRSYLFQFPAAPLAGVEYERRGALLGPWITERGKLALQPFVESLLRQAAPGQPLGITGQVRLLLDRIALSGDVRLGDGKVAAPGMHGELVGRAEGRNTVRVGSEAVGRGFRIEIASLLVRGAALDAGARVTCEEISGSVTLRLFVEGTQVRFALDLVNVKITGVRLQK